MGAGSASQHLKDTLIVRCNVDVLMVSKALLPVVDSQRRDLGRVVMQSALALVYSRFCS